jgi:NADPH:quinone reductase-like Zn-dependent oxidoreductase
MKLLALEGLAPTAILRSEESRSRVSEEYPTIVADGSNLPAGTRFDAVLDAVGGTLAAELIVRSLHPGGTFIQYGALSGIPVPQAAIAARADVRFAFLWLRTWVHSAGREALEAAFARSFAGLRDGLFASPVAATYPLSRLGEALAHQADPLRNGKILLDPRC